MMGMNEILILFAILGGISDANPASLKAPYDSGDKAVRYVLPDGHLYAHVNVEGSIGNILAIMGELKELKAVMALPEVSSSLGRAEGQIGGILKMMGEELGIDLAKDLGTVTISVDLADKNNISLMMRIRGRFKGTKLPDQMKKQAGESYSLKGTEVYRLKDSQPFGDTVVAFPDDTTILLGPTKVVEEVLTRGKVSAAKGGNTEKLARLVDRKTLTFMMLALPAWVMDDLGRDKDMAPFMGLLRGVEYCFYGTGAKKGLLQFSFSGEEQTKQVGYLLKAAKGFLDIVPALVDAGAYGVLGALPMVPPQALEPAYLKVLQDEESVLQAAKWFKSRFTGKSDVRVDSRKKTASLTLANPAALGGALLPVAAGAAYWAMSQPSGVYGVESKIEEEVRKPAIEFVPMP